MSNATFDDDVDLRRVAAAARLGWTFKSGRGFVSIRPPGGGATMIYGGTTQITLADLRSVRVPGFTESWLVHGVNMRGESYARRVFTPRHARAEARRMNRHGGDVRIEPQTCELPDRRWKAAPPATARRDGGEG